LEAKVADAVDNANDEIGVEVTGLGINDKLHRHHFLFRERESDKGDVIQVGEVTSERIKTIVAIEKLYTA
jgi:hypothetical protein